VLQDAQLGESAVFQVAQHLQRVIGAAVVHHQHLITLPGNRHADLLKQRGFPDRIEMKDAEPGQSVLLLNHVCRPAKTPFRASHAIFIREWATQVYDAVDQVPESMRIRLLSLRAFNVDGMMLDADVADGMVMESVVTRMFANPEVSYIHVHNANRVATQGE
jgi:hypothetical protein